MILRRDQRHDRVAVGQRQNRRLFADETLLNQHLRTGGAESAVEASGEEFERVRLVVGDKHPLTSGESIRLDDDPLRAGSKLLLHILRGGGLGGEGGRLRGGNAVLEHEALGEILAAFELCGLPIRTEHAKPPFAEAIDDAVAERRLGADDGEIHRVFRREIGELLKFADADRNAFGIGGNPGVAGGAVDGFHLGTLFQLPDERVFAPAGTDDQNFHSTLSIRKIAAMPLEISVKTINITVTPKQRN